MIKRIFCLILSFLLAFLLDTALFPRLIPYAVRPAVMLALVLGLSASYSLWTAGACAALGGLAEDLLCSEAIGISSACYLIAAVILSSLLRKNTFKKGILYLIISGICMIAEGMKALFFRLYGARFDVLYTYLFGGLARSFTSAACALLFISLFIRIGKGRIERS